MPERGRGVVAVVAGGGPVGPTTTTVVSLRRSRPGITILVAGGPGDMSSELERVGASWSDGSLAGVANRAWEDRRDHVLVVRGPVELPAGALDRALPMVDDDPRVATVSFFWDDASFLTFPAWEVGREAGSAHLEPGAATALLRDTGPDLLPAPIPFAVGPAVLLGSHGLSALGPLDELDGPDAVERALVRFSLRGRRRGFFSLVDPSTFGRHLSASPSARLSTGEPEATLVAEYESPTSPLMTIRRVARAKVAGLQVLIDAARLTPREMGTQVATVALIRALARRTDVARVCVALAGELPSYATSLGDHPKIDARATPDRDFSVFGRVDVGHRPFQPDSPLDMEACRAVADRTAITVLDLIAYHAVSYQLAPADWRTYRAWLRQSIAQVDGVVAPSHDVRTQILRERLPVDPERVLVAELGTDHLTGDEPEAVPPALAAITGGFVVVLGADYTHKNRDLAVRAHADLCARGFDLPLVMAGTAVHGSSRELEGHARSEGQPVVVLPDVSAEERIWLLRHASLVLYPTSAEGFGLVPFEAARLGTPTAFVPFGPLAELVGPLPVVADDWSPSALADAADRLLAAPGVARAQVEATVAAGDCHTWDRAAARLTEVYRELLARPAAAHEAGASTGELAQTREELLRLREEQQRLQEAQASVERSLPYRLAVRANAIRDAALRRGREARLR